MPVVNAKGANYATVEAAAGARAFLPSSVWGGKVRVMHDVFVSTTTMDIGSNIRIARLPKGAVPLGIYVSTPGVGVPATFGVGDGITNDRFVILAGITSLEYETSQFRIFRSGAVGQPLDKATDVVARLTSYPIGAGKTLRFGVFYVTHD